MGNKVAQRIPPRKPAWNFWQGLFLIIIVTLIEFLLGWLETPHDLDTFHGMLNFIGIGLGDALIYFTVILIFLRLIKRPISDLGFVKPRKRFIVLGIGVGVLLCLGIGLLGNALASIFGDPVPQSFTIAVNEANYAWQYGLFLILGGVAAPLKEEMFFRGLMYPPLRHGFGRGKGMILAGLFFAVLHFDLIRFIPLFIGGVVLAWLYERSASIWPAVAAHGTWNVLMIFIVWVQRF
jgi:membrane protease YdiL (CAAX protease family)